MYISLEPSTGQYQIMIVPLKFSEKGAVHGKYKFLVDRDARQYCVDYQLAKYLRQNTGRRVPVMCKHRGRFVWILAAGAASHELVNLYPGEGAFT